MKPEVAAHVGNEVLKRLPEEEAAQTMAKLALEFRTQFPGTLEWWNNLSSEEKDSYLFTSTAKKVVGVICPLYQAVDAPRRTIGEGLSLLAYMGAIDLDELTLARLEKEGKFNEQMLGMGTKALAFVVPTLTAAIPAVAVYTSSAEKARALGKKSRALVSEKLDDAEVDAVLEKEHDDIENAANNNNFKN